MRKFRMLPAPELLVSTAALITVGPAGTYTSVTAMAEVVPVEIDTAPASISNKSDTLLSPVIRAALNVIPLVEARKPLPI